MEHLTRDGAGCTSFGRPSGPPPQARSSWDVSTGLARRRRAVSRLAAGAALLATCASIFSCSQDGQDPGPGVGEDRFRHSFWVYLYEGQKQVAISLQLTDVPDACDALAARIEERMAAYDDAVAEEDLAIYVAALVQIDLAYLPDNYWLTTSTFGIPPGEGEMDYSEDAFLEVCRQQGRFDWEAYYLEDDPEAASSYSCLTSAEPARIDLSYYAPGGSLGGGGSACLVDAAGQDAGDVSFEFTTAHCPRYEAALGEWLLRFGVPPHP